MKSETKIPLRRRISFRLALRSVLIALVLGLAFSVVQLAADYSEQNKQLERTIKNMLAAAEKPAMIAAFQLDAELAHEVINGLFAYEFVVNSRIEDEFSDILVEQKRRAKTTAFSWISKLTDNTQKLHVVDLLTHEADRRFVGTLKVVVDQNIALSSFYNRSVLVVASGPLRNIVLILLLMFVFQQFLSSPLLQLIEDFSAFDPTKDEQKPLTLTGDHDLDELGLLEDAANAYIASNNRNMSELKQSEAQLKTSENRYRRMFDSAQVAIWDEDFRDVKKSFDRLRKTGVTDISVYLDQNPYAAQELASLIKINAVNQKALEVFGANNEDDIKLNFKTLMPKSAITDFRQELVAIWQGEDSFEIESKHQTFSGRTLDVIVSMPIPKSDIDFAHVPVCILDITEQKALSEALNQAQKLEAVGQLTGGVAHDFNNLLQIIGGAAAIIDASEERDDEVREWVERINKAVERGRSLTSHLLAFSRKQSLQAEVFDPRRSNIGLEDLLQRTLGEDINVSIGYAVEDLVLRCDPNALQNTLLNLAINSRAAMSTGGDLSIFFSPLTLKAELALDDEVLPPGNYVEITVRDTGAGMKPDVIARAFDPFFTTKEVGKGTGLGLSMVFGFARQSGGNVTIESALGEGTTVKLLLPSAEISTPAAAKDGIRTTPGGNKKNGNKSVLVVEDDAETRINTKNLLVEIGYDVVEAATADEAINLLQRPNQISVVFSDVVMPGGMDGYDLAKKLSDQPGSPPVLLTSGYPQRAEAVIGASGQQINLIKKPFTSAALAQALAEVLG
ncbi:MAG: response regulator [Alphaproteobacteria bacterium]|nr:response regulator [Alphaproteobacteria bacterium]MBT4017713.1 response regulator [Alphaproteobacteria bacterium]MBT5160892.1 response regulator [Alphaproteobacteria bacterium]MBT5918169.1 response regulator [Alphaproteobacteria bacterium]MBT6387911.1 response regulator [Alphaproteobacteria bacterium]